MSAHHQFNNEEILGEPETFLSLGGFSHLWFVCCPLCLDQKLSTGWISKVFRVKSCQSLSFGKSVTDVAIHEAQRCLQLCGNMTRGEEISYLYLLHNE